MLVFAYGCQAGGDEQPSTVDSTAESQTHAEVKPPAEISSSPQIAEALTPSAKSPTSISTVTLFSYPPPLASTGAAEVGSKPDISFVSERLADSSGETIHITVQNKSDVVIYPTTAESGCVLVTIQMRDTSDWLSRRACLNTLNSPDFSTNEQLWEFTLVISGPSSSGQPVGPTLFDGDLRDIPTNTPHPPGYSGPEVPRGPGGESTQSTRSTPNISLGPGIYRIAFTYNLGSSAGPPATIYSHEILIHQ
jgi:hypothetical protein